MVKILGNVLAMSFLMSVPVAFAAVEIVELGTAEIHFDRENQRLELKKAEGDNEPLEIEEYTKHDFVHSVKATKVKAHNFLEVILFTVCDGTKDRTTQIKWMVFEWNGAALLRRSTQTMGSSEELCQNNEAWEKPVPLTYDLLPTEILETGSGQLIYSIVRPLVPKH